MKENKSKIIIIIIALILGLIITVSICKSSNKPITIPELNTENKSDNTATITATSTINELMEDKEIAKIYTVNEKGETIELVTDFVNGDYENFINKIISSYDGREDVSLSKIKLLDFNKNMGTLYLNLSSPLQCSYDSKEKQKLVVDNIVKSLLSINDKDFYDIQFLVQDNNVDNIFGEGYDTISSLRK